MLNWLVPLKERWSRRPAEAYGVAALSVAAAYLLRTALAGWLESAPFLPFIIAVAFSAWYGGLRSGLLATLLSTVVAVQGFMPASALLWPDDPRAQVQVLLFLAGAVSISYLSELWHRLIAKIVANENTTRALLENAAQGIVVTDDAGRIVMFNNMAETMFGYPRQEVMGRSVELLVPEALRARHAAHRAEYRHASRPRPMGSGLHLTARRKDGSEFPAEISLSSVLAGDRWMAVTFITDVTERQSMERVLRDSEAKYRAFFELAGVGATQVSSSTGRFLEVNPRMCEITGYTRDELLGLAPQDITHPEDRATDLHNLQAVLQGELRAYRREKRYVRKDGTVIWVELDVTAVRDAAGRPVHAIGIIHEITERKRAEQALRHSNLALQRSNEDLEQFAYSASHDLQEPLRMVALYTELLHRRYGGYLDADAHTYIRFAVEGATRMQRLLSDLLAYVQVAQLSAFPRKDVDTARVLDDVRANLKVAIDESGAVVTADRLPIIVAHESHIVQLFQNLLSNAIRYRSSEPPRIHVSAEALSGGWKFGVRDNGQGIADEYRDRIFGIFKRLHGREYPGTGIGLAICRRIVARYGGRIWVESEPGKGSTFFFTLFDAPADPAEAGSVN